METTVKCVEIELMTTLGRRQLQRILKSERHQSMQIIRQTLSSGYELYRMPAGVCNTQFFKKNTINTGFSKRVNSCDHYNCHHNVPDSLIENSMETKIA